MNKKAFTLVELIGVLVILSVLALVSVPAVLKIIKNSKQKVYDTNITMIKTAMQDWKNNNSTMLPTVGEKIYLTISQLKREGHLEQELNNPLTDKAFPNDMLLTITNDHGGYIYAVDVNSGTETAEYTGGTPYIEINEPIRKVLKVGDTYTEATATAYGADGRETNTEVESSLISGSVVSTNDAGTYYVLYQATVDDIPVAYVQTVVVEPVNSTCKAVTVTQQGLYTIGDTYTCDPGDGEEYTFYILNSTTNTVSLIMDRNVGSITEWNANGYASNGPESALSYLKLLTRDWKNVTVSIPKMADIAIAAGNSNWPTVDISSLPGWLYGNLNCQASTCAALTTETATINYYWTDDAYETNPSGSNQARAVSYSGTITKSNIKTASNIGVRPVIEISKDKLSN